MFDYQNGKDSEINDYKAVKHWLAIGNEVVMVMLMIGYEAVMDLLIES